MTRWRLAHLSDPHLTTPEPGGWRPLLSKRGLSYLSWRRRRRFVHQRGVLDAVLADLTAAAPDHIAVTGDLTHLGLPNEFDEGRRWLEDLGGPGDVTVIPGNHERLRDDFWCDGLALWQPYLLGDGEETIRFPLLRRRGPVSLIGVNSAVVTVPLSAGGRVGAAQREALADCLRSTRDSFRVLLIHHSPLPMGHAPRKRLADFAPLTAVLADAGVELVLHGHGHRPWFSELATHSGPAFVVGAPSASLAGRAGWNRFDVEVTAEGWRLTVEERRQRPGDGALATVASRTLQRPRRLPVR